MKAGNGMRYQLRILLVLCAVALVALVPAAGGAREASASFNAALLEGRDPNEMIKNADREVAYVFLIEHMDGLRALYDLSPEAEQRMNDVFYEANVHIANTDMTVSQLTSYVNSVEASLTAASQVNVTDAQHFLFVSNTSAVSSASYGQQTTLGLSLVNLGRADLTDVVVTPNVDPDVTKWPFVIQTASDARVIDRLAASSDIEQAQALRREVSWNFVVASDAKTGTYPISFHVIYYRNGSVEETDVQTYIHIKGAPNAGSLYGTDEQEEEERLSTPRIIVTGFTTDPAVVYAGDTFRLVISVQNTSSETAVSNVQFDLKAAQEGSNSETTYEAFLPTSGSATIYVSRIPAGESTDLTIEMTARGDLTQKPYVVTVNAAYEDSKHNAYTATSNVSIPVRQEARVDTGEAEVLPDSVEVGGSSNVMFNIYNMGKTTLYNVQVSYEGESVEGGSTFIGKIEPGATGGVDSMVNAVAPTMGDGTIRAIVSYEDEAGNVSTLEKEISLYVYEMDYGDYEEGDWGWEEYEMEEETAGTPWGLIAGIAAGVLVVGGIITGVAVSKSKKKKRAQAELDALDDDM